MAVDDTGPVQSTLTPFLPANLQVPSSCVGRRVMVHNPGVVSTHTCTFEQTSDALCNMWAPIQGPDWHTPGHLPLSKDTKDAERSPDLFVCLQPQSSFNNTAFLL
ncbi:hypothetical protein Bbelb_033620 [Branchiostoma belcheri]|nr:hypothetical protein Bbelb_033620 [Branchiostoma belcheri]